MAAMLPILSYMGIPAFNLPTALVSNTLDYGDFAMQDTTAYMRQTLPVWKKLGFRFDAICTGLMFSEEQSRLVAQFCRDQAGQGCTIFVDPVMGPNYTEACHLVGEPFKQDGMTRREACDLLDKLVKLGTRSAIITSCFIDNKNQVCGYDAATGKYFFHDYDEIPGLYHGTGDIFSAVLIGHLMKQESLSASTRQAMDVVREMIYRNRDVEDRCCGIFIERCLDLL